MRVGITDPQLGPDMIQTLTHLSTVLYKKCENAKAQGESVLAITTLYQMIMGHSQYLTLMFNQEEQWERLKGVYALLFLSFTYSPVNVDCVPVDINLALPSEVSILEIKLEPIIISLCISGKQGLFLIPTTKWMFYYFNYLSC